MIKPLLFFRIVTRSPKENRCYPHNKLERLWAITTWFASFFIFSFSFLSFLTSHAVTVHHAYRESLLDFAQLLWLMDIFYLQGLRWFHALIVHLSPVSLHMDAWRRVKDIKSFRHKITLGQSCKLQVINWILTDNMANLLLSSKT